MSGPTPREAQIVDRLMTNFSLMYMLNKGNFNNRTVFPTIPVEDQTGVYATYPKGYFLRNEMKVRPLTGTPEYIDYKISPQNYRADEYAVGKKIDDRVRANTRDPLGPDRAAVALLSNNATINFEEKWAASFFKTGVWTNEYAGVASSPSTGQFIQFDQAGADPIGYIQSLSDSMDEATGYRPNVLTLGTSVFRALVNSPQLLGRILYSQRGVITEELLASLLGVERVNVARGVHNTAKEGQADVITRIADKKSFLLSYADTSGTVTTDTITAGANFAWTNLIPGATNALGGVITRGRDSEAYSDWLHIRQAFGQAVVAPDLAVFASAAVS